MAMKNKNEPVQPASETAALEATIEQLQRQLNQYKQLSKSGDPSATEAQAQKAAEAMRQVGDEHPDPAVKREWYERAGAFARGTDRDRSSMLDDIGRGLLILLATPFALAGAAIFAAGAVVYGAGTLVKGLGNVLTGGMFKRKNRGNRSTGSNLP